MRCEVGPHAMHTLPAFLQGHFDGLATVSYTHLTLPTIYAVYISVVAVPFKKKKKNKS